MKSSFAFITAMISLVMVSCGSSKKVQEPIQQYPNYGGYQPQGQPGYYQQQPQQGYYQQQPQQGYYQQQTSLDPDAFLRQEQEKMANENPCQYLALHWSDDEIRAYGEATGFDQEAARANARINAESELNSIMNLWASDIQRRTNSDVQVNGRNNLERVGQQDQLRFAEGDLRGVQILLVKYENVKNGVLCRMCVSMNANAATNALLSQMEVQGALKNAEAFRKEADAAREEIRLQRTGTNNSMRKQQIEFEQQMQMQNQQNQYDLERQRIEGQNQQYQQNNQNNQNNRGITIGLGF